MPALITLLYPAVEFDLDYYLNSHMKLVQEKWGKSGLRSWSVTKLDPSSGNIAQCSLVWDSVEAFQNAVTSEVGASVMADIANYTKGKPSTIVGEIVGTS
ncbi:hypothetical protein V493_03915 [Pseudogymnoascus sp. VKM F-4281 (FW-2241)]|nr:hypothetical protein V493_03915 [Pseudogymnoascus sp. VKM F-4281 (FW-2241)]